MDRPPPGGRRRSEQMAMGSGNARVALRQAERAAPSFRRPGVACAIAALALLVLCLAAASASAAVSFTRAWGWGVSDGLAQFETCTGACRFGLAGGGAGELYS